MGIIGNEIKGIISDSRIYRYDKNLFRFYNAGNVFNSFLNKLDNGRYVAVWGAGNHTAVLLSLLNEKNRDKIKFIIDSYHVTDELGLGYNVETPLALINSDIESIVLSLYYGREEVKSFVKKYLGDYRFFDIYEELDQICPIDVPFYHNISFNYNKIVELLGNLEDKKGEELNVVYKCLVGEYLHIKDFRNALIYMDMIEGNEYGYYQELKTELEKELELLQIKTKDKNNIVVNWVDALRNDEIENMKYLKSLMNSSTVFENAYTVAPYTSATMKTIFTGKYYLDDKLYKDMNSYSEECCLISTLKKYNWRFKYFGEKGFEGELFNEKTRWYYCLTHEYQIPSSIWQWESIIDMEDNDHQLYIIHNLVETHSPYMNGVCGNIIPLYNEVMSLPHDICQVLDQVVSSQHYLDDQLSFFLPYYNSNNSINIIMSDHGQYRGESSLSVEGYNHIVFFMMGRRLAGRKFNRYFSLVNFYKLIAMILDDDQNFESCMDEYALIQSDDGYSWPLIWNYCINPIAYRNEFIQHRGIVSDAGIYLREVTGEEYYFTKESSDNLINVPEYKKIINDLRLLCGNKYIDITKEKKYLMTVKFYKEVGLEVADDVMFFD